MPIAFVKTLLEGKLSHGSTTALVLSGSKTVSAGNSILLAFAQTADRATTITDNLGHTYTELVLGYSNTGGVYARLYRAIVTNPGTLTTITLSVAPWNMVGGAIAVEFSGLGAVLDSKGVPTTAQSSFVNGYPGGTTSASAAYVANTLWAGVFAQDFVNTFVGYAGGGQYVTAVEPTLEQKISGGGGDITAGFLYYLSASAKNPATLLGQFGDNRNVAAAGVVFDVAPTGVIYNDTCSGAIVFTGTVVESWAHGIVHNNAPAGTVALGGSVIESRIKRYTDASSGSLALNGTAVESWSHRTVYSDAPTGAVGIAGTSTSTATHRYTDNPSGRVTIVGTRSESAIFRQSVTGRVQFWGWAARTIPASTPQPVGVPGALAQPGVVVNPIVLRPAMASGYQVGDVLICFAASYAGASLNVGALTPGWTVVTVDLARQLDLIAKVAESLEEASPTLTFSTSPGDQGYPAMARIVAFRNLDTRDLAEIADVIGAQSNLNNANQMAGGAAVTTVYDNDLVLSLSKRDASGQITSRVVPPAGFGMVTWDVTDAGVNLADAWAYQVKKPVGVVAGPVFGVITTDPFTYGTMGVVVALKAAAVEEHVSTPSGTITLTGSRVERKTYIDRPTGSIAIVGTAVETHRHHPQITGKLVLSGAVQESWRHTGTCAGSVTLSGAVDDAWLLIDRPTGTIAVTGDVVEDYTVNFTDACSGVLRLMGVAAAEYVLHDDPGGVFKLGGTKTEFITIEDAIFYDDFPVGLIEIDGRIIFVDYTPEPGRDGRIAHAYDTGRIVRSLGPGRAVRNLTGRVT